MWISQEALEELGLTSSNHRLRKRHVAGLLRIVASRQTIVKDYALHQITNLNISLTPDSSLVRRGLRVELNWITQGSRYNTLNNLRLHLPRILSMDDPLTDLIRKGLADEFIHLFRSERYNVRDEILDPKFPSGKTWFLADVSHCLLISPSRKPGLFRCVTCRLFLNFRARWLSFNPLRI